MADTHLQVNHNGSLENRKTVLWGTSEAEKREVLLQIFSQPNWRIDTLEHIEGSYWKLETSSQNISYKINLYVSSVRDEARQPDEYKMQLGAISPIVEEGWITLIMGIYTISHGPVPNEYILSAYNKDRFTFSTNPSIRGTRTSGLQKAKILGFYKTDISYLFRPEFIYYYIGNQEELNNKATEDVIKNEARKTSELPRSLQVIYYGAPGTGKSNKIEEYTNDSNRIRTTFHPDSDYSTFVGAYKPTMEETGVTVAGKKETRIAYKYVPQAFLKAYVNAWNLIEKGTDSPYYLVIEEINRGNCAQIFGDLFQLLDRGENGESKYAICPDDDIKRFLAEEFKNVTNIPETIKNGEEMRLPSNLYIGATMNTSDQSLFPMDSAFKRRWDWEYVPINYSKDIDSGKFIIEIDEDTKYSWVEFLESVNDKIYDATNSEDKQMGNFFIKKSIKANEFVNKVMFYLWNEVCKEEYGTQRNFFRKGKEGKTEFKFTELFGDNQATILKEFMTSLGIEPIGKKSEEPAAE